MPKIVKKADGTYEIRKTEFEIEVENNIKNLWETVELNNEESIKRDEELEELIIKNTDELRSSLDKEIADREEDISEINNKIDNQTNTINAEINRIGIKLDNEIRNSLSEAERLDQRITDEANKRYNRDLEIEESINNFKSQFDYEIDRLDGDIENIDRINSSLNQVLNEKMEIMVVSEQMRNIIVSLEEPVDAEENDLWVIA
jgi:chromosome segregation ATPase